MAGLTTLTEMPTELFSGDTLFVTISEPDYPANGLWVVSYNLRAKDGTQIDITASASGADHVINVAASTTVGWLPGEYFAVGTATYNSTQVKTFWRGLITIRAALVNQPDNYDTRTHAKKCLDAIESVMEGKAGRDTLNTTIAGQNIQRLTPEQIVFWRNYYKQEVAGEQAAIDAANGLATGKNILIRFG